MKKEKLAPVHCPEELPTSREAKIMSVMPAMIAPSRLPPEQEAIRASCFHPTGTFVEFQKEEVEQSIPEKFEKIVRQYTERIAINTKTQTLTFDVLNKAANHVAWTIYQHFGGGKVNPSCCYANTVPPPLSRVWVF
jgi:non-ribosomal peptide synthetase component F